MIHKPKVGTCILGKPHKPRDAGDCVLRCKICKEVLCSRCGNPLYYGTEYEHREETCSRYKEKK